MARAPAVRITEDVDYRLETNAIIRLSRAARALSQCSGLNRRALAVLLQQRTGASIPQIEALLDAVERLEHDYWEQ